MEYYEFAALPIYGGDESCAQDESNPVVPEPNGGVAHKWKLVNE